MLRGPANLANSPCTPALFAAIAKLAHVAFALSEQGAIMNHHPIAAGLGANIACFGMGVEGEAVIGRDHHVGKAIALQFVDRDPEWFSATDGSVSAW